MPFYEYGCRECGNVVEILKSMSQRNVTEYCDLCDAPMERNMTAPTHVEVKGGTPKFHSRAPKK